MLTPEEAKASSDEKLRNVQKRQEIESVILLSQNTSQNTLAEFVIDNITITGNAGYVFTNSPENFLKAAEQALKDGE